MATSKYQPYDPIASAPTYDWRAGITGRSGIIDQMGVDALAAARSAAARRAAQTAADQASQLANAGAGERTANQQALQTAAGTGGFGKFMQAIAKQESGGNYSALNPTSGAMGKYQVMPSNIMGTHKGWDWEILGRDISISDYINSPQIQEQIAQGKLQQYYNAYGPAGAAIAWYAGPGAAKKYKQSGYVSGSSQGAYPSISGYMRQILQKMGYA